MKAAPPLATASTQLAMLAELIARDKAIKAAFAATVAEELRTEARQRTRRPLSNPHEPI